MLAHTNSPLDDGINKLIQKLSTADPKSFVFEYCPLADILNDKSVNVLLASQWIFFASQFQETELLTEIIEREFNRPGVSSASF